MSNRILILHFLAILALAACSSPPQSTATPTLPPSDTPSAVSATPTPPETPTTVPTTTPEPTPTATPEPTPSPTAVPLRFGFEPGMTVDDCNPLALTADNKIP
ncbi:MAG: hypothetical protein FJ010_13010, partial [Chloroflexi bacterium]|nr:hypothetical protein [Chloroflexota bacterium]